MYRHVCLLFLFTLYLHLSVSQAVKHFCDAEHNVATSHQINLGLTPFTSLSQIFHTRQTEARFCNNCLNAMNWAQLENILFSI